LSVCLSVFAFNRVYYITNKQKLSGNIIPGQRGKCGNLPCFTIFSANRDDIAVTQWFPKWAVPPPGGGEEL